jgi:hypothetical protein
VLGVDTKIGHLFICICPFPSDRDTFFDYKGCAMQNWGGARKKISYVWPPLTGT